MPSQLLLASFVKFKWLKWNSSINSIISVSPAVLNCFGFRIQVKVQSKGLICKRKWPLQQFLPDTTLFPVPTTRPVNYSSNMQRNLLNLSFCLTID